MCPFCGARFADAPPRPGEPGAPVDPARLAAPAVFRPVGAAPAGMVVMGGGGRSSGWVGPMLLVLFLAGAAAGGWLWWRRPAPLPVDGLVAVAASGEAPCAGADDCVLVFLTPWDDASATTAELLPALDERWAEGGPRIEVVIGADGRLALERMARRVPLPSWIDPGEALVAGLSIETAPTWLRVQGGAVTGRVEGTWLPIEAQLRRLGFE
ncbi:MAG: hypothetical protein H6705_14245 [Myxococcales bacterium]|nr:hypothetical protein [Myxococcales bacterium]